MANNISDILNGSQLIVSVGGDVVAFATSCSLSFTTNTTEIATKEFGKYPGKVIQSVEWEIQAENLACDDNIEALMQLLETQAGNGQPVQIKFGQMESTDWANGKGTAGAQGAIGTITAPTTKVYLEGNAIISGLSMNAAVGDNSSISATFTGVGAPTNWSGTQGT